MPRPVSRPIIVSVEVPGFEPVQKRIAADGKHGREDAWKAIDYFQRMAVGLDTCDPPKDGIVVRFLPAPLLNPDAPIPNIPLFCPSKYLGVLDNIRFSSSNAISQVWQLALLSTDWLDQHGVRRRNLKLLDLFLANYGLCHGMTRNDLPPGENKPWNKKPYFEEPGHTTKYELTQFECWASLAVFATREELLAHYGTQAVIELLERFLAERKLRFGMTNEELPRDKNYPWCHSDFIRPNLQKIFDVLGDSSGGILHELLMATERS
jgi:hypothetical protein